MAGKAKNATRTGANQLVFVAAVLLAVIALNIIGARAYGHWDLTEDHVFTLSQESKDLVKALPDRLTIRMFVSNDLPPPFSTTVAYARDLLAEYAVASGGKLVWEAIDPSDNKELEEEAKRAHIKKEPRGAASDKGASIVQSYYGVLFQYQGQTEVIPELPPSPLGLEYLFSSKIRRLTVKKKKIGFANSEGELSAGGDPRMGGGGLQNITQNIAPDFEVVPVPLTGKQIPDDIDALLIFGPHNPMTERAKFVIDQYLMRGKGVALFVDGMELEQPRQMPVPGMPEQPRIAKKSDVGLDDLLESYGLKIRDDLVFEPRQNAPGPVPVQGQVLVANYPTFVVATRTNEKHASTEHIRGAVMPFPSSVEIYKDKQPDMKWISLLQSSSDSWRQGGIYVFNPTAAEIKMTEDHGPFALAVAGEGKLRSFFAGKPYPNEKGEKVEPPAPNVSQPPDAEPVRDVSDGPVRMVVVGTSQMASDDYLQLGRQLQMYQANIFFALGTLGYLVKDEALGTLRSKGMTGRPLTLKSDSTRTVVKLANVIGVPLVFITFGIVRWRLRERRRRSVKV